MYSVYNRVQSIDRFAANLADILPKAKIVVAHGQMGEVALEDAVTAFAAGQGDVLVCQNCGNRFTMNQVEVEIGGCNPWPIFESDKIITEDSIQMALEEIRESRARFRAVSNEQLQAQKAKLDTKNSETDKNS